MDGTDRSLLDSLDPSVCEARVFLIFRLSSILTLIDNSVCFSRTTMIPPDCLEDCLPWIDLAARAWMGNLEVGRDAAFTRWDEAREDERDYRKTGIQTHRPTIACLEEQKIVTKQKSMPATRGGRAEEISHDFRRRLWAGIQQLDDLLGLATNTPNS